MLYNPTWKQPDPYSLEAIVIWLEQQPSDKTYDWYSCDKCLVAQYTKAVGIRFAYCHNELYVRKELDPIAGPTLEGNPNRVWTFGQALKRIKEFQAAKEKVNA